MSGPGSSYPSRLASGELSQLWISCGVLGCAGWTSMSMRAASAWALANSCLTRVIVALNAQAMFSCQRAGGAVTLPPAMHNPSDNAANLPADISGGRRQGRCRAGVRPAVPEAAGLHAQTLRCGLLAVPPQELHALSTNRSSTCETPRSSSPNTVSTPGCNWKICGRE